MELIDLLLTISDKSGLHSEKWFTTASLAKKMKVSQQTISNALRRIESGKLITRKPTNSGTIIGLTENGRKLLAGYEQKLAQILKTQKSIRGTVFTGLGEGRFYMQLLEYKKQFKEKVGIDPYPGTLNLKLKSSRNCFLENVAPIMIDGFKTGERTFGWIKCYPAYVEGIKAAIIIPERSIHKDDIIELISDYDLRRKLKLKDKSGVNVSWEKG